MGVETLIEKPAVERFHEGVVGQLAGPAKFWRDTVLPGPTVARLRITLGTLSTRLLSGASRNEREGHLQEKIRFFYRWSSW